jgi:cytoskeletal protein CcmA (bactofilin family)
MRNHLRVPELSAIGAAATVLVLSLAAPGDVRAFSFCSPGKNASYRLGAEETHAGDLYTGGQTVDISGTVDGDLVAWAQSINVTGDVRSELMGAAQTITIQGHVGDTTRVACNSLLVQGTLDGDLLVFAQTVTLAPGSRIRGDLVGFAQIANLGGDVDGDVRFSGQNVNVSGQIGGNLGGTVGEAGLTGSVQHDVRLTCDKIRIAPEAHVGGDLVYKAREPVENLESLGVVAGKID